MSEILSFIRSQLKPAIKKRTWAQISHRSTRVHDELVVPNKINGKGSRRIKEAYEHAFPYREKGDAEIMGRGASVRGGEAAVHDEPPVL